MAWGLGSAPAAAAQSIISGSLSGTVERASGGTVSDALLTIRSLNRGLTRETIADAYGRFSFVFVEPGPYEVRAEALGFRPVVMSVSIGSGETRRLGLRMEAEEPPVTSVDTVGGAIGSASLWWRGGGRVGAARIANLPSILDDLSTVAALSSRSDASLGSEGLPGNLSLLVADGVPFYRATHPAMRGEALPTAMFSRAAFSDVEIVADPPDIEWSGSAGAHLAMTTRSSSGPDPVSLGGSWSGDPLWSSSKLSFDAPALSSYWASGSARFEPSPDTSGVFIAGQAIQLETPLAPRTTVDLADLSSSFDPDSAWSLAQPAVERIRRVSGVGRLDWSLGQRRRLMIRANAGHVERTFTGFGPDRLAYGGSPPGSGTDFSLAGNLVTTNEQGRTLEIRAGVGGSTRSYGTALEDPPSTTLVGRGLSLGGPASAEAEVSRFDVHVSPVFHYSLGPGVAKTGITARTTQHTLTYGPFDGGEYFFTDVTAAADGIGYLVQSGGNTPSSSFSTTELGAFAQYEWEAGPGLRASMGGRADWEFLPKSQVTADTDWFQASGVLNSMYPTRLGQYGAVGSLAWDMRGDGQTILNGTLSLTSGDLDPVLLHEAFSHDGAARISRYAGSSLSWPGGGLPSGTLTTPTLTLLGPDSRAPYSSRASLSLVHHMTGGWTLFIGAVSRRTDFLPRRRDLNVANYPVATDPHGRDILGDLQKLGTVVAPAVGTDRRFAAFDQVWTIDTDGWSEYRGGTVGVEHRSAEWDLFASYTRSRTRDNWIGAAAGVPEAQLPPGLPGEPTAWAEGVSDFDVPDRLVAGATLAIGPLTATALVRYESGLPFTPGYRAGVDINGDGSSLNDVAWVPGSGELAGLLTDWPCLSAQADSFAERNSCRGPARKGVDARIRARLGRVGRSAIEIVVDAYGLLESDEGLRDTALLLVDPAGSLTTSPDGRTVTVPVQVNPDFGKILVPTGRGRILRVGLRIGGGS